MAAGSNARAAMGLKKADCLSRYQPRTLPDLHDIAAVALTCRSAVVYGTLVMLEVVFFRLLEVVGPVKKVKTIGGHGRSFLARHHPDKPGNTGWFRIAPPQVAHFLEESRND
jgi:hypothetical protein